jgi:hypothetical protein
MTPYVDAPLLSGINRDAWEKYWQMGREIETPDLQRRWRVFGTESVNVTTDAKQSAPYETIRRRGGWDTNGND